MAHEEVERLMQIRTQTLQPDIFGSPDERTAWLKQLWWKLPRYVRPLLYFTYRMFFQLGILEGQTGVIFHFLQAFWFRLIVDVKIDEILGRQGKYHPGAEKVSPLRFVIIFAVLFAGLYYFDILFFGLTTPGNHYIPFLDHYLNYIAWLRAALLKSSACILNLLGFTALNDEYELLVAGHGILRVVYSCLGLGVISFFCCVCDRLPQKGKIEMVVPGSWYFRHRDIECFAVCAPGDLLEQAAGAHH